MPNARSAEIFAQDKQALIVWLLMIHHSFRGESGEVLTKAGSSMLSEELRKAGISWNREAVRATIRRLEKAEIIVKFDTSAVPVPYQSDTSSPPAPYHFSTYKLLISKDDQVTLYQNSAETVPEPSRSRTEAVPHNKKKEARSKNTSTVVDVPEGSQASLFDNEASEPPKPKRSNGDPLFVKMREIFLTRYRDGIFDPGKGPWIAVIQKQLRGVGKKTDADIIGAWTRYIAKPHWATDGVHSIGDFGKRYSAFASPIVGKRGSTDRDSFPLGMDDVIDAWERDHQGSIE